mmetsp:Transcript_16352/g.62034  ORF Transcript_16352/g.62034 Transcript_16352/m.62034 type:complete len:285 (+) Transcript_16352:834-1688(+)
MVRTCLYMNALPLTTRSSASHCRGSSMLSSGSPSQQPSPAAAPSLPDRSPLPPLPPQPALPSQASLSQSTPRPSHGPSSCSDGVVCELLPGCSSAGIPMQLACHRSTASPPEAQPPCTVVPAAARLDADRASSPAASGPAPVRSSRAIRATDPATSAAPPPLAPTESRSPGKHRASAASPMPGMPHGRSEPCPAAPPAQGSGPNVGSAAAWSEQENTVRSDVRAVQPLTRRRAKSCRPWRAAAASCIAGTLTGPGRHHALPSASAGGRWGLPPNGTTGASMRYT